jgi:hypothetical protein
VVAKSVTPNYRETGRERRAGKSRGAISPAPNGDPCACFIYRLKGPELMSNHPIERFNDWVFEFIGRWFLVLLILAIFAVCAGAIFLGEGDPVCSHAPHFGACSVPVTTMVYDVNLKTIVPYVNPCGCTSDHGVQAGMRFEVKVESKETK